MEVVMPVIYAAIVK